MQLNSTMYTMGTALNHALDAGIPVRLLVGGQWIDGHVLAVDGHGVILGGDGDRHAVVKVSDISAVEVLAEAPVDTADDVTAQFEALTAGDLPTPRRSGVA